MSTLTTWPPRYWRRCRANCGSLRPPAPPIENAVVIHELATATTSLEETFLGLAARPDSALER